MSMINRSAPRARRWGIRIAIGTTLVAALAVTYAFTTLFARPGEAALRYIPADAVVVASIDLSPSPSQTLLFKKIDDALARNEMSGILERGVLDMIEQHEAIEKIRPYTLRNAAFGLVPNPENAEDMHPVLLLALSDGAEVQSVLKATGHSRFWKGAHYYKLPHGKVGMMVIDDLLVIAGEPWPFHRIKQVASGAAPSILTDTAFVEARNKADVDANLMVFVSPQMFSHQQELKSAGFAPSWMGANLTLREGGLALNAFGKVDTASPFAKAYAQTHGLRNDLFKVMPSGSYGMVALSQPANIAEAIEGMVKEHGEEDFAAEIEKGLREEMGLSLHEEVLPALKGTAVFAAYPTETTPAAGVDGLLVLDDLHGADPAALAAKLQDMIQKKAAEHDGPKELYVMDTRDGANFYRIADEIQSEMRKGLGEGIGGDAVKTEILVGKKTIAWATVGKALFISTSQDLLNRAVGNYKSKAAGLESDQRFASVKPHVMDGSQTLAMFSVGRMAEGIRNTMNDEATHGEDGEMFDSILTAVESLKEPLYLKGKVATDGSFTSGLFVPMDYDKLFDFIGQMMKNH